MDTDNDIDIAYLKTWIGRRETARDMITPVPVAALSATLDRDDPPPLPGMALPPLWHWLYFLPTVRQSELGADGHALRGGFLPPVKLPRRMWAGGRLRFHAKLRVGEMVSRHSRITDVALKEGRSGRMIFVLVRHEITGDSGLALTEEHDIVYRDAPTSDAPPPAPRPAPADALWRREIVPDDVLLFRYSALTFNGHRIHYDRRYVTGEEGYPGLVVHGPLIATLLLDLVRRHSPATVTGFNFRAIKPLFDTAPFIVCGAPKPDGGALLWAQDETGAVAMEAEATLSR
jgi:3-methylfumaryl-CoA hydratase